MAKATFAPGAARSFRGTYGTTRLKKKKLKKKKAAEAAKPGKVEGQ